MHLRITVMVLKYVRKMSPFFVPPMLPAGTAIKDISKLLVLVLLLFCVFFCFCCLDKLHILKQRFVEKDKLLTHVHLSAHDSSDV